MGGHFHLIFLMIRNFSSCYKNERLELFKMYNFFFFNTWFTVIILTE